MGNVQQGCADFDATVLAVVSIDIKTYFSSHGNKIDHSSPGQKIICAADQQNGIAGQDIFDLMHIAYLLGGNEKYMAFSGIDSPAQAEYCYTAFASLKSSAYLVDLGTERVAAQDADNDGRFCGREGLIRPADILTELNQKSSLDICRLRYCRSGVGWSRQAEDRCQAD